MSIVNERLAKCKLTKVLYYSKDGFKSLKGINSLYTFLLHPLKQKKEVTKIKPKPSSDSTFIPVNGKKKDRRLSRRHSSPIHIWLFVHH